MTLAPLMTAVDPAAAGAQAETTVVAQTDTRLSFRTVGGLIVFPVSLNGSRPLQMVLDTGMSAPIVALFHAETVDEIGLEGGQPVQMAGAGGDGMRMGRMFPGAEVLIGDLRQENQTIVSMDEDRETSRWSFDGIIGKSLFDAFTVEIDYVNSVLSFYDPGSFVPDSAWIEIPLTFQMGIPILETTVDVAGRGWIPAKLVVDFGARHNLALNVNPDKGIVAPDSSITAVVGRGVSGIVTGRIGRIHALTIGPFSFEGVVTSFTDESDGATRMMNADGNLGVGVYRRFGVVMDYSRERMLLRPNDRMGRAFEYNMAGLSLEQSLDGSFAVRDVLDASSGESAGIEAGDRIVGMDGKPVGDLTYDDVYDRFRTEGISVRLEVERGSERFEHTLVMERML